MSACRRADWRISRSSQSPVYTGSQASQGGAAMMASSQTMRSLTAVGSRAAHHAAVAAVMCPLPRHLPRIHPPA